MPETYAFAFVVLRLASATRTSLDGNSGALGERPEALGQGRVVERREAIEDRFEQHGSQEPERDDQQRCPRCGDRRPPIRQRASESDECKEGE